MPVFGEIEGTKPERALEAARRSGAVVVYKGADTLVAAPDGRARLSPPAPAWLATAGTGDVLAGMIAAMRARGLPAFEAACAGVWLQARAAEIAGPQMIADDLADAIPAAIAACARADRPNRRARRRRHRERDARRVRSAGRCAARRWRARARTASSGAAVPPLSRVRRVPAPACRRRGVSRLSRFAHRDGAGAARSCDGDSRAAPVAAEKPQAGDAARAEGREGRRDRLQRREVASNRRHARVPYPAARAVRAGASRCASCSPTCSQPKRAAEVQLTLVDQGVDVLLKGVRGRRARARSSS